MKLIIEINKEMYECVKEGISYYTGEVRRAIRNGTPIPDNATNGDVIKAIFPNSDIEEHRTYMKIVEGDYLLPCAYQWWNSPYQKDGE